MGTLKNGIAGNYSGKIGNLVFYEINGKQVVRTVGKITKPPTEKQLSCRQQITVINSFLKPVIEFVNVGFKLKAKGTNKGAYNMAVSHNKKQALQGIYPSIEMDYPSVLLTQGSLTGAISPEVEQLPEGLKFTWLCPTEFAWPFGNDQVMLMAYFPKLKKAVFNLYGAKRSGCEDVLNLQPDLLSEYMEVYISFIAENRTRIANSTYLGNFNK
ncbi:hypothetical protein HDC92_002322 [Pedobacter sp. AK017]|uniref:DUF6266 family protein n=1 Tax=Pedobacter sp. AK017 TaxID=2723073 RepID=UPI0016183409|nr:DUF6266 family protein [Pedobacter sp. AK017]MBB5438641.1 hypothetical protein [Pedobacter sp. AK017]